MARRIDVGPERTGADELPAGGPVEEWTLHAVGPGWTPPPGEAELAPVPGRLTLHGEAVIFRSDADVTDLSGEPVTSVIPADSILDAAPLSPGSHITPSSLAGTWMPALLRRLRCPGFVIRTTEGTWAFDSPSGQHRALAISRRYLGGRRP